MMAAQLHSRMEVFLRTLIFSLLLIVSFLSSVAWAQEPTSDATAVVATPAVQDVATFAVTEDVNQPTPVPDTAKLEDTNRKDKIVTRDAHEWMPMPQFLAPERYFVDTRIAFILGDDDFLHKAGETIVDSPLPGFGNRPGYELFFDNLDSARTGRENQFHIVLYKKLAGYIPGLVTEGAIVTRYDFSASRDGKLQDAGTYLLVRYQEPGTLGEFSVTMFPVSTDRFRLGYLYDLTWGGADVFASAYRQMTPGIKLNYRSADLYAFLGFKTARVLTNPPPGSNKGRENETVYAVLGGFGWTSSKELSIEANGGYFQMGENPNLGVEGEMVHLLGASARIAYMNGLKLGMSADLRLFRSDPEFVESLMARPSYKPGLHYLVSLEGNFLEQSLSDPDQYGTTVFQPAYAGALNFKMQKDLARLTFTLFSRSLSFILLNVPSYVPYQAMSTELENTPEVFAALGADYYFPKYHLTLGGTFGLQMPAAAKVHLTATTGVSEVDLGLRTIVVRNEGELSVLPDGEDALPILGAKLSLKWDLSDIMSMSFVVLYQRDPNFTTLKTLPNGTARREFEDPNKFGAAVICTAKF